MWKAVFGVLGAAVAVAVVNALSEMRLEKAEEEKQRRQKLWEQEQKDAARRRQEEEEAPKKEKERLRLQEEGDRRKEEERLRLQAETDERKEDDLDEKWGPTVLYWEGWLGRDQLFRFKPAGIPDGEHFDAKVVEVRDQGLLVRETLGGQTRYVPFEGMKSSVVAPPEEEEDDEDENED